MIKCEYTRAIIKTRIYVTKKTILVNNDPSNAKKNIYLRVFISKTKINKILTRYITE